MTIKSIKSSFSKMMSLHQKKNTFFIQLAISSRVISHSQTRMNLGRHIKWKVLLKRVIWILRSWHLQSNQNLLDYSNQNFFTRKELLPKLLKSMILLQIESSNQNSQLLLNKQAWLRHFTNQREHLPRTEKSSNLKK